MSDKQRQLDNLAIRIVEDGVCQDLRDQATQLVMGEGSTEAEVVFIGEAPGKREDEQGRPFVGASGKMLDTMLQSIGLARQDVYITNIVKYRPPNNRDPLAEEKAVFWPYLLKQLDIIEPKVVVTLGRHSGMNFMPDLKIGEEHGLPRQVRLTDGHLFWVLPLYHPAAALYNGSLRQTLLDDFSKIPSILEMFS